ncbi:hypothetical protein BN874_170036 [Candidatus Contendobacter odensis Run_B_J11]|uniref:Ice-binding protein C-terminal domain-containing protein n=1 Tax=Candidatus Contendobacter odensis Run_B_J11 TaxID=1400861 RepID=A0A7U7GB44_9GAMM|nr:hypothetical protein BN874_170036 [Candidatus Contendobacter odensis Run_B_J11]
MWAGPTPAHATTLQFSLNTAALNGTAASLAFDFIGNDGLAGNNTVVVSNFYTSGTLGNNSFSGGIAVTHPSPPGPFPVTLTDSGFFNEFLQELTLGDTVSFTLNLTEQLASSGSSTPDSFSFFLLDASLLPLFATSDPLGADALFAVDINGTPSGTRYLFNYAGTGGTPVTWTLEPVAVPLPSTALLVGVGLLGWVAGRRRG